MSGDGAQPAAEGTVPPALEAGQFADENAHDFLNDVLGLLASVGSRSSQRRMSGR